MTRDGRRLTEARAAMTRDSTRQKDLYESIHTVYRDHYYDDQSMDYRRRFYYDPAFGGLDLNGCAVADLACGSGYNSLEVLRRYPRADVTGFDISAAACADYRRLVASPAHEFDLTRPLANPDWLARFDAAMIWGGLHHCVSDLPTTLRNVAAILKPNGRFIMLEPNADFVLNGVRRLWYRLDRYFDAKTEDALTHRLVHGLVDEIFDVEHVEFLGGPGYFLVAQSMIFRLPKPVKRAFSGSLIRADGLYNRIGWSALHPYFIARWRRRAT